MSTCEQPSAREHPAADFSGSCNRRVISMLFPFSDLRGGCFPQRTGAPIALGKKPGQAILKSGKGGMYTVVLLLIFCVFVVWFVARRTDTREKPNGME
jgi:hypothetical protein